MKLDERALKAAMKQMGIKSQEITAEEVIIRTPGKDLVIKNPQVTKMNMMGQDTFQISGTVTERAAGGAGSTAGISHEDIKTVMEQAGVDEKTAVKAIEANDGDLAAAIIELAER